MCDAGHAGRCEHCYRVGYDRHDAGRKVRVPISRVECGSHCDTSGDAACWRHLLRHIDHGAARHRQRCGTCNSWRDCWSCNAGTSTSLSIFCIPALRDTVCTGPRSRLGGSLAALDMCRVGSISALNRSVTCHHTSQADVVVCRDCSGTS